MDFNDLTTSSHTAANGVSQAAEIYENTTGDNELQPRAKRIACVLCRKRKLRCDGARPKCATCHRLSHDCSYDEVRKKSGPKRGYVKLLEARLQQVETLLQKDTAEVNAPTGQATIAAPPSTAASCKAPDTERAPSISDVPLFSDSTDLISLGLDEMLPPPEVIADLHDLYFEKVHASMPMLNRSRYLAALMSKSNQNPPICLRYSVWAAAASISDKYHSLAAIFYQRSRKYLEADEMKGHGESMTTLGHCQTWVLVSFYEFKNMYFPRAWQSTGRASSMAVMMMLNRIDGPATGVKQCLPPAKDWAELEERRRTFWLAFTGDRYASVGTGWSFRLDEHDIMTNLPASDHAYNFNIPEITSSLEQALSLSGNVNITPFSSVILMASLLGRNLTHLHRPSPNDNQADPNGEFWQRHRRLENLLANIGLALPDHLRIPAGLPDPNIIFMNMLLHTAVICLHQAAIFKADQNGLPQSMISESRARCVTGASEITRIMKMLSHIDMSPLNPFMAFSLYVAARVFVQYVKWQPGDSNIIASLKFLGSAMHILSRKNPLTTSFLAQLEVDLEGTGLVIAPKTSSPWVKNGEPCVTVEIARSSFTQTASPRTSNTSYLPTRDVRTTHVHDSIVNLGGDDLQASRGSTGTLYGFDVDTPFTNTSSYSDVSIANLPHRTKGQSPLNAGHALAGETMTSPSMNDLSFAINVKSRSSSYQDGGSHPSRASPSDFTDEQRATSVDSPSTSADSVNMTDGMFFDVTNDSFANIFGTQLYSQNATFGPIDNAKFPQGWNFGVNEMSSGLTPVVEADWDEALRRQNG